MLGIEPLGLPQARLASATKLHSHPKGLSNCWFGFIALLIYLVFCVSTTLFLFLCFILFFNHAGHTVCFSNWQGNTDVWFGHEVFSEKVHVMKVGDQLERLFWEVSETLEGGE